MVTSTPCLVCDCPSYQISSVNGCHLHKCSSCRLEFTHPMPTKQKLTEFYKNYFDPRAASEVTQANALRNIKKLKNFGLSPQKSLLDYGAGNGSFCKAANTSSWQNYDPYTKDNSPSLLQKTYKWITLWGVLEHVTSPSELLTSLSKILDVQGQLALTTVTTESNIPYQHKPPEHLTYWTRQSLTITLEKSGFEILTHEPYVMQQKSDIYLNTVLRTVPEEYRKKIRHELPSIVTVPTNEVFVVARKTTSR